MKKLVEIVKMVNCSIQWDSVWLGKIRQNERVNKTGGGTRRESQTLGAFTLIELMVVMSVLGIILGLGIAKYNDFNRSQIVSQAAKDIKNDLRLAQSKSLSGEKPSECTGSLEGYRVRFPNDSIYRIFAVCTDREVQIEQFSLPSRVTFQPVPSPILFKVLGEGAEARTITVTGFGKSDSVVVTANGEIN